ncbi:MAG: peptidylprolyl isomerase [Verrucomicrobiota bacterium]
MKKFLAAIACATVSFSAAAETKVTLKTSMGDIVIELNAGKAPATAANFLSYVKKKHYDGTVFHRVIPGFMIQGGGLENKNGSLTEKATDGPVKNESQNGLKNVRGSVAMARTSDPDSATAQFFINVKDNPGLDFPSMGGYTVFGKVVAGMEVVEKIEAAKTGENDVPVEAVVIKSATAG